LWQTHSCKARSREAGPPRGAFAQGDFTQPRCRLAAAVTSTLTGLYFDPKDKRRAWVNIQHPASGNDRTIEITIADPKH